MIIYYSIHPTTHARTKIAMFELRDGVVHVAYPDPRLTVMYSFKQIVVDGPNGRPMRLTPADGQRFLDGLLELNRTRTYASVVDE